MATALALGLGLPTSQAWAQSCTTDVTSSFAEFHYDEAATELVTASPLNPPSYDEDDGDMWFRHLLDPTTLIGLATSLINGCDTQIVYTRETSVLLSGVAESCWDFTVATFANTGTSLIPMDLWYDADCPPQGSYDVTTTVPITAALLSQVGVGGLFAVRGLGTATADATSGTGTGDYTSLQYYRLVDVQLQYSLP